VSLVDQIDSAGVTGRLQRMLPPACGCLCNKAVVMNTQNQGVAAYFREDPIVLDGVSQKWDKI
jgi:hypothetical protein